MVELELVGLSEDGTRLVLADAGGDEFGVAMDDRLRAVVRRAPARSGPLETSMESALRPRDIQARIRAGEHPEAVAEIAQVPVDRIMGYAVPVMAERQHIADRAQRSAVRRKNADGPGRLLGEAVAERLRGDNVDPDSCQWDAWRRDDGRWTVQARFHGDGAERTGLFIFDALSRYTLPDDDDARWLVGERVAEPAAEATDDPTGERSGSTRRKTVGRRLSAVASEYDASLFDEPDHGSGEAGFVGSAGSANGADHEDTADLSELTAVADVLGAADTADTADTTGVVDGGGSAPESDEQPAVRHQQPKPEKRGRRGRGRAQVPSWDEIMFGQPKG
ncbi:MAG: septation protein SepH [Actinomycetota bacterium]|nr:septation protein SepH [Actinomycetota bacterium]